MKDFHGFPLSLTERLRSRWNGVRCSLRNRFPALPEPSAPLPAREAKTTATLEYLRSVPPGLWPSPASTLRVLDAGCHDFSRARALHQFFTRDGAPAQISGVDLDAHFVETRAKGYAAEITGARWERADFFRLDPERKFHVITCFFPFVSPHPALAWGLPHHMGDARLWIRAIERHLLPGGTAFTAHQGPWEEEEFLGALTGSRLHTVFLEELPARTTESLHPIRIGLHIHRPA